MIDDVVQRADKGRRVPVRFRKGTNALSALLNARYERIERAKRERADALAAQDETQHEHDERAEREHVRQGEHGERPA